MKKQKEQKKQEEELTKEKKKALKEKDDRKKKSGSEELQEVNVKREILEMVLYVIFVILIVWLITTFVGQRTVVDGSSMYDTLEDGDNLWVSKLSYLMGDPERFDIVIFPVDDEGTYYIKRVIGLPGETVRIDQKGNIFINDKPLEESYGYETIIPEMLGRAEEGVTLGEDEYFVMGDNRNGSFDSREEEVGNIERERLVGKAVFRIWPFSKFGTVE